MTAKKLVLFDIDGTLLKVEGVSRNVLIESLRKVYGTEGSAATHDFSGKMDGVIIREVMQQAGLSGSDIARGFDEAKQVYIEGFKANARREHVKLMAGITELLDRLSKRDDVVLSLLTGNFEQSGRHKLALPEINHYFAFGAFADDAATRDELPPVAVARAEAETGKRFEGKDVVIIGDTEHDVRCARVLNSRCIAVATGHLAADQLRSHNPDITLETLADTAAVIDLITA